MSKTKKISFKITESGCFEVTSHRPTTRGYFKILFDHIRIGVHRLIYQECFGPIPEGMSICHHCDNTSCINPEHLFMGTHKENMQDMAKKGRQARGERNGKVKLNRKMVLEVKKRHVLYNRRYGTLAFARKYHVSSRAISSVIKNRTWGWL